MKIFLICLGFFVYLFIWAYVSILESTDEYLDKSMDKAYKLAELMESNKINNK